MIKTRRDKPIVADRIRKQFGIDYGASKVIITYSPHIYTFCGEIDEALYEHEKTHLMQQEQIGVELWWENFFTYPSFRLQEEVEAYRNQWKWYQKNIKNREERYHLLNEMARILSGEMYGNIITKGEALKLIKQ